VDIERDKAATLRCALYFSFRAVFLRFFLGFLSGWTRRELLLSR
jgi:hypothetical protein